MKNKKILKLLAGLTLGGAAAIGLTMAGCSHQHDFSGDWVGEEAGHYHVCPVDGEKDELIPHVDNNHDNICDDCEWELTKSDEGEEKDPDGNEDPDEGEEKDPDENEDPDEGEEKDPDENEDPDEGVTQYTVTFHLNGHGTELAAVKVDENGNVTKPEDPTDDDYNFIGWYSDENCTSLFDFTSAVTADVHIYALWEAKIVYQEVTYEFVPSNLEAVKYDNGFASGIFTVLPGTTVRSRSRSNTKVLNLDDSEYEAGFSATQSVQLGATDAGISVNALAAGTLVLYVDNGSTETLEDGTKQNVAQQSFVVTKPDGSTQTITYKGTGMFAIIIECEEEGIYKVTRGSNGTTDIYYASFKTTLPITPVEKIQIVDEGYVEYFVGQELDLSMLKVQLVREVTGLVEPIDIEDLIIDSSNYNKDVAGDYEITVTYTVEGQPFNAKFTVTVVGVESIELGLNKIIQGQNTSAGNGAYINHSVRQFYFRGEEFDEDGLTVTTVAGDVKSVVTEGYNVAFDSSVSGKQTVTISWGSTSIHSDITVYVASYTVADVNKNVESVTLNVDASLEDDKVGALINDEYNFKSIQQALEFLNAVDYDQNTKKLINVAAGYYKEKLEINIPNLTIRGGDSDASETVIEWDALYGLPDEGGFIHVTDSTATLNVREGAEGFVIENITISNWFNSEEHFTEALGANYKEHRALAVLIQADKVVMDNCRMLGYQDTLELFTGRQVIQNSYINGRTDFIFGTNNTTYFYNCEIESILGGGYIAAFKGLNKGVNDSVTYGAIFDNCNFTCSTGVADGSTSIARPWDVCSAVAVINSKLGAHISKKGYDGSSGTRYVAMSATSTPLVETVKFVEYNNSGEGALISAVAGMRILDASEAANYSNKSVIFGTTNGKLTYSTAWDGTKGVEITEKTYKFSDYFTANDEYNAVHDADNETVFDGDITIVSGNWGHELNQDKDQAKFNIGTVIKFNVAGKVTLTTYGGGYGELENVIISYKDGYATLTIVATDASPIKNGCYITQIKLDMANIPADSEIKYSFVNDGEDISGTEASPAEIYDGDITVIGNLRNNNNSYQVTNETVLKFAQAGIVKVEWYQELGNDSCLDIIYTDGKAQVTFNDQSSGMYIVSITVDTSIIPEDTILMPVFDQDLTIDLMQISTAYDGTSGYYEGIFIDATNGKFANNNSGWMQMNAGTVLTVYVAENIEVNVVEYGNAGKVTISERSDDGMVTITANDGTYINAIIFSVVKLYDADAVIDMTPINVKYEGTTGSYKGVQIDATNGKFQNNGDWVIMNAGTVLKVQVAEGMIVTVKEYEDKGYITVGERDSDGWVSITTTAQTYISTITVQTAQQRITSDYKYTYVQNGRTDGTYETGDKNIKFDGCVVNNSWLKYGTITLDVAEGATIKILGYYEYDVKVSINGVELTEEDGYYTYTVSEAGMVVITATTGYLRSIEVVF